MQELYENLLRLGIAEAPAAKMAQYGQKVAEANAHFNLTRILGPAEMAESHFVDSVDAARKGYIPADARIIDIGTGAGFPGVPLAIFLPEAQVTLLDSSEKKTDFIREACAELGIPVRVVCGRSEELARGDGFFQAFDIAVARAVARLNVLLELCAPYVRRGGRFLAYKGASAEEEVTEAASAAKRLGMQLEALVAAGPASTAHKIAIYRRVGETPPTFPRKYAKIKKAPL